MAQGHKQALLDAICQGWTCMGIAPDLDSLSTGKYCAGGNGLDHTHTSSALGRSPFPGSVSTKRGSYVPSSESRPETNGQDPRSYFSPTSRFSPMCFLTATPANGSHPYRKRLLRVHYVLSPFTKRHRAGRKRSTRSKPPWTPRAQS